MTDVLRDTQTGLKEYFVGLTEEQYVVAVQAAAIAILVHYFKEDIEYNKNKDESKKFKIEWFPNKWLGFWETFTPRAVKSIFDKETGEEKRINFTIVEMLKEFVTESIVLSFKRPLKNNKMFKANTYTINPQKKDFIIAFIVKGFPTSDVQEILAAEIKRYKQLHDSTEKSGLTFKSILS